MKVTEETFSFQKKRKEAEEERYQKYPNFQVKGLLPDFPAFHIREKVKCVPVLQK
jgi:Cu/Zn superoxide dismutase